MAPLPKRRHSSYRQAKRTRALKIPGLTLTPCPNCKKQKVPHMVCGECGFYKGVLVVEKRKKIKSKKHQSK